MLKRFSSLILALVIGGSELAGTARLHDEHVCQMAGMDKEFSMVEGKEVARLECRVEPATKQVRNTKIRLAKNAAGQSLIQEIQLAGENVKHILSANAQQLSKRNH